MEHYITFKLDDVTFRDLIDLKTEADCPEMSLEGFAREAVEAMIATRRLAIIEERGLHGLAGLEHLAIRDFPKGD